MNFSSNATEIETNLLSLSGFIYISYFFSMNKLMRHHQRCYTVMSDIS